MKLNNLDLLIPKNTPSKDSYSWGVVTHQAPMRVRMDGFSEPIYITDTLVPAHVGDRVYVHFRGTRTVVLGASQ